MYRVLWADDAPGMLTAMELWFKTKFGNSDPKCELVTAANIEEAIINLKKHRAELVAIVSDLRMPYGGKKPGFNERAAFDVIDAAKGLKDEPAITPDIPVIVYTGYDLAADDGKELAKLKVPFVRKADRGFESAIEAEIRKAIANKAPASAQAAQPAPEAGTTQPIAVSADGESPAQALGRIRMALIKVAKDLEDLESRLGGKG